jgi:uncharacterized protein
MRNPAGDAVVEHPHARAVRRLMAAFTAQDRDEIEALIDVRCVWRVPGDNVLAGEYDGLAAVMGLFGTLKRIFAGPAQFEIVDLTTSDDRAIAYQYGVVQVGDRTVRMKECLVYRFERGKIVEVDEFQFDQAGFDDAFSPAAVAAARPT